MKKIILSLSAITTLLLSAFSVQQKEVIYKVDSAKSSLVWVGKKVTGEHKGTIEISSGAFSVVDKKLTGGRFEFNVAGLTVTDIADPESNARLVKHLKNDDFFATDKFPKATFVVTTVENKGNDNYSVTGDLTIKGITKPITFPAVVKSDEKILTATGLITVNRTDFDIKYKSTNFFENLGDKAIYDDFTLDVKIGAVR